MAQVLAMPMFDFVKQFTEDREAPGYELLTSIKNVNGACSLLAEDKRSCTVYKARPLQCSTYPFWTGNLIGEAEWSAESVRCEGIGHRDAPVVPAKQIAKQLIMSQIHARGIGEDWTAAQSSALLEESAAAAPDTYDEFLRDFASSYSSRILSEDKGVRVVETTLPASEELVEGDSTAAASRTTRRLEFAASPHFSQTEMAVLPGGQLDHSTLLFPVHRAMGLLALLSIKSLENSSARVAVIGAGGGALPSYILSTCTSDSGAPAPAIDAIEPSPEVLSAAYTFFALPPPPAVNALATTGEEYLLLVPGNDGDRCGLDVVVIDACGCGAGSEGKEDGGEITAPPATFFSPAVLHALHARLCLSSSSSSSLSSSAGIVAVNVLGPREHEQALISAVEATGLFSPVEALGVQGSPNRLIVFAAKAAGERARLLVELLLLAKDAGVSRREE